MSFTCPDCLWTSHHPQDRQNLYCGHCHRFVKYNLEPTEFESALIKAILSRPEIAPERVRRVILAVDFPKPDAVFEAIMSVTLLSKSRAIEPGQRALLAYAGEQLRQLDGWAPPDRGMTAR